MRIRLLFIGMVILLSACAVGPNYRRPAACVPCQYKEIPPGWKKAEPCDVINRGKWWEIFHDPILNCLEEELIAANQSVKVSYAQYVQALALIEEARSAFFPSLSTAFSIVRQKGSSLSANQNTIANLTNSQMNSATGTSPINNISGTGGVSSIGTPVTTSSLLLNASWEPDLWGQVRRTVEADTAGAESSQALLINTLLSAEATLAQTYFELRGADQDQELLDRTVADYLRSLKVTQNRYNAGVAQRTDVLQAESLYKSTQATAINNKITRAKYEHAIAVLIGRPPACLCLRKNNLKLYVPKIPLEIPSRLLERRPDIAQYERLMAQANAQIGVAISAFFPNITLSATSSLIGTGSLAHWLASPIGWAAGPQLAETILDGGLRTAAVKFAYANYQATVANYRQTVLAAFQDVEDNLVSLRFLKAEEAALNKAADDSRRAVTAVMNQYKAGTASITDVLTAENSRLSAEKSAIDVRYLELTSAVGLIKALGGGWCF